jgi:hypothetical protein
MISLLAGLDTKKKSATTRTLTKGRDVILVPERDASKELIDSYAAGVSMFGTSIAVVLENVITKGEISLSDEDLRSLADSQTLFIFLEDKLLVAPERKYKKYATIERFDEKKVSQKPAINTFAIADAFGMRDKVKAWMLYREAIESGMEPEPISGILFWKIKNMLLTGTKSFTHEALTRQSSELVSLYHRSHRGESDFVIGLEQFILSSLSR